MMEILATVLGVCFVALVMLSLCRAAARADAMAQHDWRVFCDEKARKARGQYGVPPALRGGKAQAAL